MTTDGTVMTTDGTPIPLVGIGSVSTHNLYLLNVYCIPALSMNLVSIGQLCDSEYLIQFSSTSCHVKDLDLRS